MAATLDPKLAVKLGALEAQREELSAALSDPAVTTDLERFRKLSRAFADLEPLIAKFGEYRRTLAELEEAREIAGSTEDAELRALASEELGHLDGRVATLEQELKTMLLPTDPHDEKNVVLEVRAGAGGDEASLFAAELFRMYRRFAEEQGWRVRTTHVSESGVGGIKEVIAVVEGERVYSRLKFESGVHRVQRVPETEAQGRIHTSAVTVAVMPEADDVEVELEDKDLRIDTFCSSGPGGQSVNTTQSAVRVTHLPTGLVVQCQDEKSWHKNKARALQVLRSRLYDRMLREQQEAIARERRGMVGTGDRSEKIRTYNFPQDRVTDHRVGVTLHNLPAVLGGAITPLLDALSAHEQAERLKYEVEA